MSPRVALLAGGVGGAKLADGLYRALTQGELSIIANPGDDFELHGLTICPDHDTLLYTLAGLGYRERGWGLAGETWNALEQFGKIGSIVASEVITHMGQRPLVPLTTVVPKRLH